MMSLQCRTSVALNGGSRSTTNPGVTAPGSCTVTVSPVSGSPGASGSVMAIGVGNVPISGEPGCGSACPMAASLTISSAQNPTASNKPCLINAYSFQEINLFRSVEM